MVSKESSFNFNESKIGAKASFGVEVSGVDVNSIWADFMVGKNPGFRLVDGILLNFLSSPLSLTLLSLSLLFSLSLWGSK